MGLAITNLFLNLSVVAFPAADITIREIDVWPYKRNFVTIQRKKAKRSKKRLDKVFL
jgi:hypothetical protein